MKLLDHTLGESVSDLTKQTIFITSISKLSVLFALKLTVKELLVDKKSYEVLINDPEVLLDWARSELEFIYRSYPQSKRVSEEVLKEIIESHK